MSLRKRIADSEGFNDGVAALCERYIRFAHRTSSWDRLGFEPMEELVRSGEPVIVALWHQRLVLSPYCFPLDLGPICSITSEARGGRLAGRIQQRFGFDTIAMSTNKRHITLSREVLGKIKQGVSVGIATDGPSGPARIASTVPLIWARSSGKRVFTVACATRNAKETGMWDKMLLPRPFSKGVFMCREWDQTVPRKASADQIETLRLDLQSQLNELTADCDRYVGRAPYVAGA